MKKHFTWIIALLIGTMACTSNKDSISSDASDQQKIIYDVIRRSLTNKDMPSFRDLKEQEKIYLNNTYINFIKPAPTDPRPLVSKADVPATVEGLPVELISEEAIQDLADKTGRHEFILVLGNLAVTGDSATVAIDGWYRGPKAVKVYKMSGGGGIMHYKKENNTWVFQKFSMCWIS